MTGPYFLDANIIMYAMGGDHPLRAPCRDQLERIKKGELAVVTSTEVLQELLHRYLSLKMPGHAEEAFHATAGLCRKVFPVTLSDLEKAMEIIKANSTLNARDAVHAAVMLNNKIENILSTDQHFDAIEGIKRVAP